MCCIKGAPNPSRHISLPHLTRLGLDGWCRRSKPDPVGHLEWQCRPGFPARPRQKATESRLVASPLRLPTASGSLGSLYGTFGTICRPCRLIWSTPGGAGVHWLAGVHVCGCRGFRNPTVASITNGTDGAAWSVRGVLFFFALLGRRGTICLVGIDDDDLQLPAPAQG